MVDDDDDVVDAGRDCFGVGCIEILIAKWVTLAASSNLDGTPTGTIVTRWTFAALPDADAVATCRRKRSGYPGTDTFCIVVYEDFNPAAKETLSCSLC